MVEAIFHASHSCLIFINLSLNRQKIPTIEKDKLILGQRKNSEVHCVAQISNFLKKILQKEIIELGNYSP